MLFVPILFPMCMALVTWLAGRRSVRVRNLLAALTALIELGLCAALLFLPDLSADVDGVAGLGLHLTVDGFRRVYLIVIAFLWAVTTLIGGEYFSHYTTANRYYFFNLFTLGATVGVFLSRDLFTALVFFEIMSFTSYPWVVQEETEAAKRAADTYLAVAVIGGLFALFGLFLLQHTLGTTEIDKLYEAAKASGNQAILYVAGGCVLFGFGAKAGMFPLHIWLPKAHPVAPAPASALLSGLLTKSGVFGVLAITCSLFRHDPAWGTLILILGVVTMLLGALLALFSVDLKRTLACSSVSQIGFILVGIAMLTLLGEENALAARGTLLHMVNHSLFKLVLFSCAAVVYMNLHALNLNDIRGFGRKKPLLMIAFLCGALGIGGFPLFNGYVSKTLLHESIVEYIGHLAHLGAGTFGMRAVEWLFLLSGGITVAYMTKLFVALFVERHPTRQAEFDAKRRYMRPLSAIALLFSALLLPALGLTANVSMNAIADLGTDFLRAGPLEHAVHYLSWENLKGGLISIAIGFALYFGVVRTVLMRRENGVRVYVNRWPARLDLEELVYRPLLLKWLPGLLGPLAALFGENRISTPLARGVWKLGCRLAALFGENRITEPAAKRVFRIASGTSAQFGENRVLAPTAKRGFRGLKVAAHALSDLVDALVLLLKKTVYRDSPPPEKDEARASLPYRFGKRIDRIAIRRGHEEQGGRRYAITAYRARRTLRDTGRRMTDNLSFALLMLVGAISLIFLYMLVLR